MTTGDGKDGEEKNRLRPPPPLESMAPHPSNFADFLGRDEATRPGKTSPVTLNAQQQQQRQQESVIKFGLKRS